VKTARAPSVVPRPPPVTVLGVAASAGPAPSDAATPAAAAPPFPSSHVLSVLFEDVNPLWAWVWLKLSRSLTLSLIPSARASSPPEGIWPPSRQSIHSVAGNAKLVPCGGQGDLDLRQAAAQEVGQSWAAAAVELEAHQAVRGEGPLGHEAAVRGQMNESAGAGGGLCGDVEHARAVQQDLVTTVGLGDRPRGDPTACSRNSSATCQLLPAWRSAPKRDQQPATRAPPTTTTGQHVYGCRKSL